MRFQRASGRILVRGLVHTLCACAILGVGAENASAGRAEPGYVTAKMTGRLEAQVGPTEATRPAPEPAAETPPTPVMPRTTSDQVSDLLYRDALTAARVARMVETLEPGTPREHIYEIAQSVARWTRVYSVRAELLIALIDHESRFDPMARSATNDHGLCQLHGRPIYGIDANVQAGVAHFAGNLASACGDEFRALCEYNGGPGGVGYSTCQAYARGILEVANGVCASVPHPTYVAAVRE